jgi:hypothetical protein
MVQDTVGPQITCVDTANIFCGDDETPVNTGYPTSIDQCDNSMLFNMTDRTFLGVCDGEKIIYRTWEAVDSCGNIGESCEQVINVRCISCVEIEKIVSDSAMPTANKNEWVVEYRLAVWNPSIFGITYDLTDTLMYGDGINVVSATSWYTGGDGQQGAPGVFVGDAGLISDDEMLGPDANDTFTVRVVYTLDLNVINDDEADCSLTTGSPDGTGLMNSGVVIHPTITVRDTVCEETPYPILSNIKEIAQDVVLTGNPYEYNVKYRIIVDNSGTGKGWYDLSDTLKFGTGITVVHAEASYEAGDGISGIGPALPLVFGGSWLQIADDEMVLPSRADSFIIDVTFEVDPTITTAENTNCLITGNETGSGLINTSEISDGYPIRMDTTCIEFAATLGDTVWLDANANGIQDNAEIGVDSVIVFLYDVYGTHVRTDTTDATGHYLFEGLPPGQYFEWFILGPHSTTHTFTAPNQGGDDNIDSDVNLAGVGHLATLGVRDVDLSYDAGLVAFASISDFVWEDQNGNGIQDPGEPGIEGIEVFLYDTTGTLIGTDVTDNTGFYIFDRLFPGDYYIKFVWGPEWTPTLPNMGGDDTKDSDVDGTFGPGTTGIITLVSGDNDVTIDLGLFRCVPIGDFVWFDLNADGIQDVSENGFNGVRVYLYDENNNLVDQTITGPDPNTASGDGYYKFCAPPGTYFVVFERPGHLASSDPYQGMDPEKDSDITHSMALYSTDLFTVVSGVMKCDIDGGFHAKATMGDRVWYDVNTNGIQDANEQNIEGVVVSAFSVSGTMLWQDVSNKDGKFYMDGLSKGDYYLQFDPPSGYTFTAPNIGLREDVDSDVDGANGPRTTALFKVDPGQHQPDVDAGLVGGVLPIELLHFNATLIGNHVQVDWTTAIEINNDFFEVERRHESEDQFRVIGIVDAAGTVYTEQDYRHLDYDIDRPGVYYYRLRQVDYDETYSRSEIREVTVSVDANSILIYPNPASDLINIRMTVGEAQSVKVDLQDKLGRQILEYSEAFEIEEGTTIRPIDINLIPAGVYMMNVYLGSEVYNLRFTKVD